MADYTNLESGVPLAIDGMVARRGRWDSRALTHANPPHLVFRARSSFKSSRTVRKAYSLPEREPAMLGAGFGPYESAAIRRRNKVV